MASPLEFDIHEASAVLLTLYLLQSLVCCKRCIRLLVSFLKITETEAKRRG
jgi:hypothetical protein